MKSSAEQRAAVLRHFGTTSPQWRSRYERPPQRMSDLDVTLRREIAQRMLGDVRRERGPEPLDLLDVGCGAGVLFDGLPPDGYRLHGVDLVPEMVALAAQRHAHARCELADATNLPFADRALDIVTCLGVLEYVPEPQAALRELRRVLRPGGELVISFPNRHSVLRALSRLESALATRLGALRHRRRARTSSATSGGYAHQHWSAGAARRLLAACGFETREIALCTYGLWGRLGRNAAALALSRRLSRRFGAYHPVAGWAACTLVIRARAITKGVIGEAHSR